MKSHVLAATVPARQFRVEKILKSICSSGPQGWLFPLKHQLHIERAPRKRTKAGWKLAPPTSKPIYPRITFARLCAWSWPNVLDSKPS